MVGTDFAKATTLVLGPNKWSKLENWSPVAVIDVSDPDALIEVVARALLGGGPNSWDRQTKWIREIHRQDANAALTALGVLPKRRGK